MRHRPRLKRIERAAKALRARAEKPYIAFRTEEEYRAALEENPERLAGKKVYVGCSPDDWPDPADPDNA